MFGRKKIFSLYAAIILLLSALFLISTGVTSTQRATAYQVSLTPIPVQKGICYATWDKKQFASDVADRSLDRLSGLGVNFLQINVTCYQEKYNSTIIKKTDRTPTDSSLIHAIKYAKKLGMKIMLKPHIDLIDKEDGSYWRADIGFADDADWDKWFDSYNKIITGYAKLAEKYDVDIFCIGTELSFTTQKTDKWIKISESVKDVFSGDTIYAANWDNYKNIKFWNKLDYVGIDAYFPLSYEQAPKIDNLINGWNKWIDEIETWLADSYKPVIFTEIGYASTPTAAQKPWEGGYSGNADVEMQAKCYTAFFETVWKRPWLRGVYWWRWAPSVKGGGKNNRLFTPLNKPAERIIAENYSKKTDNSSTYKQNTLRAKDPAMLNTPAILPAVSTLSPGLNTDDKPKFRKRWTERVQKRKDTK